MDAVKATNQTSPRYTSADWNDIWHVGPGTLAGRYLRMFWQPVYVADELPVGRARPIRIMGEEFSLYRGESGAPHVVGFRCAHRRTQLSFGLVEGENIRCRYHGWAYEPTGQCVEQPAEPQPFYERIKVGGYPAQEYLGLIFAYLGEGEPPEFRRFPDFEEPGVIEIIKYVRSYSYQNIIDNDGAHIFFTHTTPGIRDWREWNGDIPIYTAEETDWGVLGHMTQGGKTRRGTGGVMPNILFRLAAARYTALHGKPPTDHLTWRVPIDDENHISYLVALAHVTGDYAERYKLERRDEAAEGITRELGLELAAKVIKGELDWDDLDRHLPADYLIPAQDHVTQGGQGAIPDHESEHLGRTDVEVVLRRQVFMRELRNLAEGQPLKQWSVPTRDQVGSGA